MHHLADDGPGTDDRDLHDEVVELRRLQTRQRRHLRARLHLEHADGVGLTEHAVDGGIVLGEVGQIHTRTLGFGLQALGDRRWGRQGIGDQGSGIRRF